MEKITWKDSRKIMVKIHDDTYTYIKHSMGIFHQSLRCINYYRAMKFVMKNDKHVSISAFITISNALMESSVIGWIKLFGSEKEDTYFTKIIQDNILYADFKGYFDKINVQDKEGLKNLLLKKIGMSNNEFHKYQDDMKKFRDKFIAHTDLSLHRIPKNSQEKQKQHNDRLKNYPSLAPAEQSLFWFYDLITEILISKRDSKGDSIFQYPSLDDVNYLTEKECDELKNGIKSVNAE